MSDKKKGGTIKRAREADTGRYTTLDEAKKHPKTTVVETDKKPTKKK